MKRKYHIRVSFLHRAMQLFASIPPWAVLLCCVVVSICLSYPLLTKPMYAEADAYSRAMQAWEGIHPSVEVSDYYNAVWLPFHKAILHTIFTYFPYLEVSGRIVTFVIATLGIGVYYWYVRQYFSQTIASLSTILFTMLPLRYVLGTQTLSEGIFYPFFLFVLGALGRKRLSTLSLILLSISLSIASGIRYEMWWLLPIVWMHYMYRLKDAGSKAFWIIVSLIVPIWWTIETFRHTGIPFAFALTKITTAHTVGSVAFFNLYISNEQAMQALYACIPLPFLILVIIGVYTHHIQHASHEVVDTTKKKEHILNLLWYFLPIYFLLTINIQVYLGTMEWIPQRYVFIPVVLLLPYFFQGVVFCFQKNIKLAAVFILAIILFLPSYIRTEQYRLTDGMFSEQLTPKFYSDYQSVIHFIKPFPHTFVTYINSAYDDSFFIGLAYFTEHLETQGNTYKTLQEFLADLQDVHPGFVVLEEPPSPQLLAVGTEVFQNSHFTVLKIGDIQHH